MANGFLLTKFANFIHFKIFPHMALLNTKCVCLNTDISNGDDDGNNAGTIMRGIVGRSVGLIFISALITIIVI